MNRYAAATPVSLEVREGEVEVGFAACASDSGMADALLEVMTDHLGSPPTRVIGPNQDGGATLWAGWQNPNPNHQTEWQKRREARARQAQNSHLS